MHCGKDFRIYKPCQVNNRKSRRSEHKVRHIGSTKLLELKISYAERYILYGNQRFYRNSWKRNFKVKGKFKTEKRKFLDDEFIKLYNAVGSIKNLNAKLLKPLIFAFEKIDKKNFAYEKKRFPKDFNQKETIKKCDELKGAKPVDSVLFEYYLGKLLT